MLVPASRALNLPLAQLGHDFYEVVFFHKPDKDNPNSNTARATWKRGQNAGVSGVFRGVDYSLKDPLNLDDEGTAVLFVGTSSDKTLLAIGELTDVREPSGASTGTLITSTTASVTFSVQALKSAVDAKDKTKSSFKTAALDTNASTPYFDVSAANTILETKKIAENDFPFFRLADGAASVNAEYDFFVPYIETVIVAGEGKTEKIEPRYSTSNGNIRKDPKIFLDDKTEIKMRNNQTAGETFANPVRFSFDTLLWPNGSVFAMVFSIPVYALTTDTGGVLWHIRPGYGTYLYDLDDGKGGAGGAVLCGFRYISSDVGRKFVIVQSPYRWKYNGTVTQPWPYDPEGMILEMQTLEGSLIRQIPLDDPGLKYKISGIVIEPMIFDFEEYYGLIWITVEYDDPDTSLLYYDEFPVLVAKRNSAGVVDVDYTIPERIIYIFNDYDFQQLSGSSWNVGTHIIILRNSLDMPPITFQQGPNLFLFLADHNHIWGRGLTIQHEFGNWVTNTSMVLFDQLQNKSVGYNQYYFGKWPFPDYPGPFTIGSTPITGSPPAGVGPATTITENNTSSYQINAAGSVADVSNGTINQPGYEPIPFWAQVQGYTDIDNIYQPGYNAQFKNYMFRGGHAPGRETFVWVEEGMEVYHRRWLH